MKRLIATTVLASALTLGTVASTAQSAPCVKGQHTSGISIPCQPHAGRVHPSPTFQHLDEVIVHKGDTLWNLAVRHLGNGHRYPEIQRANGLHSTLVRIGQTLVIPKY